MAEMICAGFLFAGVVSWVSYSVGRHKGYMEACEDIVKKPDPYEAEERALLRRINELEQMNAKAKARAKGQQ